MMAARILYNYGFILGLAIFCRSAFSSSETASWAQGYGYYGPILTLHIGSLKGVLHRHIAALTRQVFNKYSH